MAREEPPKKRGKRIELAFWLERTQPARIGEPEFETLLRELTPISHSYLRRLLRESGAPLAPMVEGVRQGNLDELESTLLALLEEYQKDDPAHRARVRQTVILAKDRARWSACNSEKRAGKEEMILWMVTWLENPPVFPGWVKLRRTLLRRDL